MTVENKERFMEYANKFIKEKKLKAKINDDNILDYNAVRYWKFKQIRGNK